MNRRLTIFFFLLPSLVGLLLFSIIPIGTSLYLSLTEWDDRQLAQVPLAEKLQDIIQNEEFPGVGQHFVLYSLVYPLDPGGIALGCSC